ncbi:MAG: YqgE/AlgH family protein [Alphaproteobacteria bacterium]|nr:YqgE/AlgH family protein [Alphaproteobacteria bacterium]MBP9877574.1 YqgE/AlgH family protein [Alphaproteobacteria bacterium]
MFFDRKKEEVNKTHLFINHTDGSLTGKLLIAKPGIEDHRFHKSVIYICAHNQKGAMGLVINRLHGSMNLSGLLEQLNIPSLSLKSDPPIFFGGPLESARGFVLHSNEISFDGTLNVDPNYSMTATIDILKALANGNGPNKTLLALGHAGWAAGELDREILEGGWFIAEPTNELLFDMELDTKWERALAVLGAHEISMLSTYSGKA